jgi:hypothetical protein
MGKALPHTIRLKLPIIETGNELNPGIRVVIKAALQGDVQLLQESF